MASERLDFPEIMQASREIDDTIGLIYLPRQCGHCVALGATGTNLIGQADELIERMELENSHFSERLTSDEVRDAITTFFASRAKA